MAEMIESKKLLIKNFERRCYPISDTHREKLLELEISELISKLERDEMWYCERKLVYG